MNELLQQVQAVSPGQKIGFFLLVAGALYVLWYNRKKLAGYLPWLKPASDDITKPDYHARMEAYRIVRQHCEDREKIEACETLDKVVLPLLVPEVEK